MRESSKYDKWSPIQMVAECKALGWDVGRDARGRLVLQPPKPKPIPQSLMLAIHRKAAEVLAYVDRLSTMRGSEKALLVETALDGSRVEVGDDAA